jgi:hypothetical protein
MSNEDRLFMSPVRPQSAPAMTVIGGRIVPSSNKAFPLNGQQLQVHKRLFLYRFSLDFMCSKDVRNSCV